MTRPRAWCERPSIYEAQSESSLCDLIDRRKPSKRNLDIVPKCSSRHRACLREPFNSLEVRKGTPPDFQWACCLSRHATVLLDPPRLHAGKGDRDRDG